MILSQNALQNACGKHQWQVITQDFAQFSERFLKLGLHTALGDPALGRDFAVGLAVDAPGRENLPRQFRHFSHAITYQFLDLAGKKVLRITKLQRADILAHHATLKVPHFVVDPHPHLQGPQVIQAFVAYGREDIGRGIAVRIEPGAVFPIVDESIRDDILGDEPVLHISDGKTFETGFVAFIKLAELGLLMQGGG